MAQIGATTHLWESQNRAPGGKQAGEKQREEGWPHVKSRAKGKRCQKEQGRKKEVKRSTDRHSHKKEKKPKVR